MRFIFQPKKLYTLYDIPVTVHYDDATRGTTIYYFYVYTI